MRFGVASVIWEISVNTVGGVITIGCATWIGSFFKGTMDDVAVFPFALTDDYIARAARSGVVKGPLLTVSPSGKVATARAAIKEQ